MKKSVLLAAFLLSMSASTFADPPAAPVAQPAAAPAAAQPSFGQAKFDSALTDQARIYAGMLPLDTVRCAKLTAMKSWQKHRTVFEENWTKLDKRLQAMSQWRDTALAAVSMKGATLFYPFSGPDFLNADVFFPDCENSVYISLEGAGSIPSMNIDEKYFNSFLEDVRHSMEEIFQRNYFITSYMSHTFHTPYLQGNLAVFMIFLARRNCAIVSIDKVHIDSAGNLAATDTGIAARPGLPASRSAISRPEAT